MNKEHILILGLGPIRSGTTYLFSILKSHYQIATPKNYKESNFWIQNIDLKSGNKFLDIFNLSHNEKYLADISPLYFGVRDIIEAKSHFKNIKVIINMREPVSKLQSSIRHMRAMGQDLRPIDSYHDNYTKNSILMYEYLEFIYSNFDKSNIYLLDFDQIKTDPENLVKEIAIFLELPLDHFIEASINQTVYKGKEPRNILLAKVVNFIQKYLRYTLRMGVIADYLAHNSLINKLFFRKTVHPIDIKSYLEYEALYKDILIDIEKTEQLLGLNLSSWRNSVLDILSDQHKDS